MGGRDVVSFSRSAGAGPAPPPWEGEAVGDRAEFKLPMLGKCMKLRPLPDQDPRREYGVIWDSCRQPGEGWGYVFEFTGKRRGRILAWMTAGGAAYACDEPLAYVPEGEPDVLASRLPEDENAGQVEARSGRGLPLRLASRYRRVPRTGSFAFEQPACDLGSYAGSKLDLRTFLAVAFLAFVHLPQESGAAVPCGRMADVVDDLLKPPLPDACDLLVHRVRSARPGGASGFELYAARLLEEAGSSRLRAIAAHADIGAGRLSTTGLAWLRFDEDALDGEERNAVLAVESALNRLALIEASVAAADGAGALYAGYDEGFCSELDWRALCGIAAGAGALARGSGQPNEPRGMFGVQAAQGGEWDVRTRFAQACEGLRLPFRLEYRFDADAAAGVLAVECSAPLPGAFPAARWDAARAMWEDVRALRGWAASAYAMRLAAVLAAAAFGAGIGMARAVVTVRPGSLGGQAGMSLAFDRIPFLADVLPRIEAGALADPAVACDPAAVLALLDPADRSTAFLENGFFATVQPLDAGLAERRPLWMDERPLPASLSATLRADRACELDVLHDEDADLTALVAEALEGAESSPLASIAVLEELSARVGERECGRGLGAEAADGAPAASAAPAGGGRMPLYCANPAARALVALADGDAGTRYRKASDAAFAAHSGLSRLYLKVGDAPRALEAAEACRSSAPTSLPGYLDAVSVHMEGGRFAEAEALLRRAQRFAVSRAESFYLCYRLAYALWRQGRVEQALACYAAVADGGGAMAGQAEAEMADLMKQEGLRQRPSPEAAAAALRADGIAAVPSGEAAELLAQVAVGLADAGLLEAAAPLALAAAQITGDDALLAAARSLEGVPRDA